MKNLITTWKEFAKINHESIAEGVRHLNIVCGTKVTPSCINEMAKGKKAVPASINRFMGFEAISSEYKKLKKREIDIGEFMQRITIPKRIR